MLKYRDTAASETEVQMTVRNFTHRKRIQLSTAHTSNFAKYITNKYVSEFKITTVEAIFNECFADTLCNKVQQV